MQFERTLECEAGKNSRGGLQQKVYPRTDAETSLQEKRRGEEKAHRPSGYYDELATSRAARQNARGFAR
jgi:hypothetical protein